jgi:hypothetical protein
MAKAPVPTPTLPKTLIGKQRVQTPYSRYERGDDIRLDTRVDPNVDVRNLRAGVTAAATIRTLAETDALVSTALANFVAVANTPIKLAAYSTGTQEFSRDGVLAAESVLSSLDSVWDYSKGFADKRSLAAIAESAIYEVLLTGGVGLELVLTKERFPDSLVIFPYDSITWKSRGDGSKFPSQTAANPAPGQSQTVELNLATIFVAESLKSANRLYTLPLIHAGIQQLFHYKDYLQDVWRVVKQSGQPRLVVTLNHEKVVASAPIETKQDETQLASYLETVRGGIENVLKGLAPEDALVLYDVAEVESHTASGEKKDIRELMNELAGLAASALKSNPSLLGLRMSGSQNVATTETMIAVKTANMLRRPVEEAISRALTLAVRLYGVDVYIEASFAPIDLRPDSELAAHRQIFQAIALELLSLGRITDDEAQQMMGLGSLPEGAPELAGTMFRDKQGLDALPASGTNARNTAIAPDGPTSGGGRDNAERS